MADFEAEFENEIQKRRIWFVSPRVVVRDPPGGQLGNLGWILEKIGEADLSDVTLADEPPHDLKFSNSQNYDG